MTVSFSSPSGPRLVYKGDWQAGAVYHRADVVYYAGSSWLSLVSANLGHDPMTSPSQWGPLARKGDPGATGATGATGTRGPRESRDSRVTREIQGSRDRKG